MNTTSRRKTKGKFVVFGILLLAAAAIWMYFYMSGPSKIKATWIWNSEMISNEADDIVAFSKQNEINLIYLHIDQKSITQQAYRSFIQKAGAAGIQVDALAGDPLWSLPENQKSIQTFVDWVQDYNQSVNKEERFHGIHVDIEFYTLAHWKDNQEEIIKQWMTNMELLVKETKKDQNLEVSADVPFWINELMTPGTSESLSKWLIHTLDHITLMSYRDRAEGTNSILEIVTPILNEAGAEDNKVVVGVNLLKSSEGNDTTFHEEGLDEMERQLTVLREKLKTHSLYAGIAIHDYASWRELAKYTSSSSSSVKSTAKAMPVFEAGGIKQIAKVNGEHLTLFDGTSWKQTFWAGMNLGATTPGHFPGELTPSRTDYLRWFSEMQEMNVKVIRIYTILPPVFYEALNEFNKSAEVPLFIMQGIWAPDESLPGRMLKGEMLLPRVLPRISQKKLRMPWESFMEIPVERRAMWRNRLTNEENFGVIAVEPGKSASDMIILDGNTTDWEKRPLKVKQSYDNFDLTVSHDEAYLYLLLKKQEGNWDFSKDTVDIGFDTLKGGSLAADKAPGITFSSGIEFLLHMQGEKNTRLFVNSAYDQHTWLYAYTKNMLPGDPRYSQDQLGLFLPWKLALNKALYLPVSKKTVPFEEYEGQRRDEGGTLCTVEGSVLIYTL